MSHDKYEEVLDDFVKYIWIRYFINKHMS